MTTCHGRRGDCHSFEGRLQSKLNIPVLAVATAVRAFSDL
jgi:hypothetical protein